MSKGRYVNFARKKKFKGHSGHFADVETNDIDVANGASRKVKSKKRPAFKFSVKEEEAEIERLQHRYQQAASFKPEDVKTFSDFPLSKKTLTGLQEAEYLKPTVIQRDSILAGVLGEDVLAAAKTGSGKTLAFLIPILERLYVQKWTRMDGLGALIITPTRELALQIFETMAKVGKHHDFTTGLIIGGQNLKFERNRLHNLNIIIGTPGRLLQHMDENPLFDATNLKVLVLDEADRCLDMGFASTMNAIVENLPSVRQTLLFSATQTKSVRDLARVKLTNPRYIAPHEHEQSATPVKLQQSYVVVTLPEKLTMLWSFLRTHPKQKIIVFLATCKQVKYFYQIFKKLRPANLLLPLYGGMNQEKRNKIYTEFCGKKTNVCLLATDVASRGLDFPKVNWVVQMDCPEDVAQYIHRAGRTARLNTSGENLLVLLPHEEQAMLESLEGNKIPIKQIRIDERQLFSPLVKIQSMLAQSPELKECAKRAFVAYVKSVALMKNREVFQLQKLNLDGYAKSLGLNVTPRVRFLSRVATDRKPVTTPHGTGPGTASSMKVVLDDGDDESDADDDGELLRVKRVEHDSVESEDSVGDIQASLDETPAHTVAPSKKRMSKAKMVKKSLVVSKRTVFNEEGAPIEEEGTEAGASQVYDINEARLKLQQQDAADKERYKQLKKAKRAEKKEKDRKKKVAPEQDEHDGDDFGSESDTSVNLDWLPDPDKVYGKHKQSTSEDESQNSDEDDHPAAPAKKKRMILSRTQDLSLNEAEQLAMNLLK
ncbi:DEAD box ATP-dependent RNA helicase [Anopheles darlingi]|uniref:ATP-dependent RNA helicase n=1 Tax=Anopheles darlingi TaxID=43151 RepID=W5JXC7_ANODA|nr:probable ATP-dependent RNA helicase DDX10 [Anopheles darlingi]ETN68109.1 DEAD box ATP-dependent RNA helicase [Anopheles darlingi]